MREIEIFLELVDRSAQVKAFQRGLGLSKSDIAVHMTRISLYRDVIRISKQIKELFKDKAKNFEEIKKLRQQMRTIVQRWKDGKV